MGISDRQRWRVQLEAENFKGKPSRNLAYQCLRELLSRADGVPEMSPEWLGRMTIFCDDLAFLMQAEWRERHRVAELQNNKWFENAERIDWDADLETDTSKPLACKVVFRLKDGSRAVVVNPGGPLEKSLQVDWRGVFQSGHEAAGIVGLQTRLRNIDNFSRDDEA